MNVATRRWLLFLLTLLLTGCGDSGDAVFTASPSGQSPQGATATVQLASVLEQTAIPAAVDSVRATGFDDDLNLWYGPVSHGKASLIEWTDVPVEVTDFVLEYLANGRVVGIAQVALQLSPQQTFLIENPTILAVSAPLESLTISPTSQTIASGTSTAFTATGRFADGSTLDLTSVVEWSSGNEAVSEVEGGVVEGLSPGTSTIRATFAGFEGEATVVVSNATVVSLQILPASPAIAKGTSVDLRVEGFFSDGSLQTLDDATLSSSNETVAVVVDATAEGLSPGQSTITASFQGKSASTVLTVTNATLEKIEIQGGLASIALGTETRYEAIGTFSDDSTQDLTSQATWLSSSPSVAEVEKGRAVESLPNTILKRISLSRPGDVMPSL